ncbi:LITAF-like zinc ribbon domain-containing protein [Dichotomocladium elegans]|nr:LITAF-like zinc ribbon domain-containing protein [Dichotomocladium elegans]
MERTYLSSTNTAGDLFYRRKSRERSDSGWLAFKPSPRLAAQSISRATHSSASCSSSSSSSRQSLSIRSAHSGPADSTLSARIYRFTIGTPVLFRFGSSNNSKPRSICSSRRSIATESVHAKSIKSQRSWRMRRLAALDQQQWLPDFETQVLCNQCEKYVQSRIRYRVGALTWLVAFVLFLCTVFLFWIPFYVKYFKDVVHYCPACSSKLGTHYKL